MEFSRASESFTGPTSWTEVRGLKEHREFAPKDDRWNRLPIWGSGCGGTSLSWMLSSFPLLFSSYLSSKMLTGIYSCLEHPASSKKQSEV